MTRLSFAAAALLVLAARIAVAQDSEPVTLLAPVAPPASSCVPGEVLSVEDLERLRRFAAIPGLFPEWERRNCYPRRVDGLTLASLSSPLGVVVSIVDRDLLVVDPGSSWLERCAGSGLIAGGAEGVTGSDLATLLDVMAATPELESEDLREIGLAKGRRRSGGDLFALYLGTPKRAVHVQCFEELRPMVVRAAEALRRPSGP